MPSPGEAQQMPSLRAELSRVYATHCLFQAMLPEKILRVRPTLSGVTFWHPASLAAAAEVRPSAAQSGVRKCPAELQIRHSLAILQAVSRPVAWTVPRAGSRPLSVMQITLWGPVPDPVQAPTHVWTPREGLRGCVAAGAWLARRTGRGSTRLRGMERLRVALARSEPVLPVGPGWWYEPKFRWSPGSARP